MDPSLAYYPISPTACGISTTGAFPWDFSPLVGRELLPLSTVLSNQTPPYQLPILSACSPLPVPINPILWSKEDVESWLRWCAKEFSLSNLDPKSFSMNGKALCLLPKESFSYRTAQCGDVLFAILQKLIYYNGCLNRPAGSREPMRQTTSLLQPESRLSPNNSFTQSSPTMVHASHQHTQTPTPCSDSGHSSPGTTEDDQHSVAHPLSRNQAEASLSQIRVNIPPGQQCRDATKRHQKVLEFEDSILMAGRRPQRKIDNLRLEASMQAQYLMHCGIKIHESARHSNSEELQRLTGTDSQLNFSPTEVNQQNHSGLTCSYPFPISLPYLNSYTNYSCGMYVGGKEKYHEENVDPADDDLFVNGEKTSDCRLLWEFLSQLLKQEKYSPYIKWEDEERRIFRIQDPTAIANLWGRQKNRTNMTYEKLSRALRYYYKTGIIQKEPGQKLTYRFLQDPKEIANSQRFTKGSRSRAAAIDHSPSADMLEDNDSPSSQDTVDEINDMPSCTSTANTVIKTCQEIDTDSVDSVWTDDS